MMLKEDESQPSYNIFRRLLKIGFLLWNRFSAHGSENVPATGGCIVCANHTSYLDPPVMGVGIRHRQVRFLGRDTLYKSRLLNWILSNIGVIPLDRTRGDIAALRKAIQILRSGAVIGLFPEGTRSPDGTMQAPKGGIGFLIAKAGVPVIPAYISGTFHAYPRGARFIRPAKITITYGPPIPPETFIHLAEFDDGYEQIARLVMEKIAALRPA